MRFKIGRPDVTSYSDRFDVPPADGAFRTTFLGVSSVLLDDGESAVLTDGFFSRPPLRKVQLGKVAPDPPRIEGTMARAGIERLDLVTPVHTHFDHALDSAVVAGTTGAVLAGGESAANIGRGHGLEDERVAVVTPGEPRTFGNFQVTWIESAHCPPDRFPGEIPAPVVPPVSASAYKCGEAWSIVTEHTSGRSALIQGSAGYVPGSLTGRRADVAYLGVGQLGLLDEDYIRTYWAETVETVGARRAVLIHWDDFFRPLDRPLRALPYAFDDLDTTMRIFAELATEQDVALCFPTLWRREDPWAGIAEPR